MSKMVRGQFKGRTREQYYEWLRQNADHYSVFFHRPRFQQDTQTLEEALAIAKGIFDSYSDAERKPNPCLLYAVKGIHSSLVGTYDPVTGFKPAKE